MLLRRDCKRLGDIAAATLVVHEPRAVPRRSRSTTSRRSRRRGRFAPSDQAARHRARGARADADRRAARRARRARRRRVGRRAAAAGPSVTRRVLGVAQWVLGAADDAAQFEAAVPRRLGRARIAARRDRAAATRSVATARDGVAASALAALYRRACEHLALARARVLSGLPARSPRTADRRRASAHLSAARVRRWRASRRSSPRDFPRAVRAHTRRTSPSPRRCSCCRRSSSACSCTSQPELILSVVERARPRRSSSRCTRRPRTPSAACATRRPTG